ncbi:hypothetical protein [Haloferula sp. BvORR071]|uniref:hypothetical protein n=1 Tax=Haloferula sp. BvORR071 TaxID=1396141 RepID=UPI000551D914|nr:hypothetical protein [Haloferula sp. BvORR071]
MSEVMRRPAPWWRSLFFWGGMLVAGYLVYVSWDAKILAVGHEARMIRVNTEPPQTLIVDEGGYRYYPGQVMGFDPAGGPCGGVAIGPAGMPSRVRRGCSARRERARGW